MGNVRHVVLVALAVILATALGRAGHAAEMRFALVIGNDEYKSAKLATPANDAGLVASALQAAGFTVTGARNLDQATLRESFREFVDQLAAAGPDAVAFVYLAGFGLQFEGENFFVPVDADPQRDVDIPLQAVRVSDFMQPLAALPGRAKIVILDAARQNQFARGGQPLAGGLALVDPGPNMAIAFNAAPGTVGPDEQGPYGAYATSLTEMIAAGGLGLDDVFARVRLRVSELTNGGEIPWYASQIEGPFFFTDRVADAPPPPSAVPLADLRRKPMRGYSGAEDAYEAALAMDSMEAYEQFLAAYPDSPFARRISAMLAVRREEIIWRRCVLTDTPPAYWSYLRRYPRGPHVWDARRRLARLGGAMEPPPSFAFIDFGVPPPPAFELDFVGQPVVVLWGPSFAPPPRPPVVFLPPRPREFAVLPPPPATRERFSLPAPAAPVGSRVRQAAAHRGAGRAAARRRTVRRPSGSRRCVAGRRAEQGNSRRTWGQARCTRNSAVERGCKSRTSVSAAFEHGPCGCQARHATAAACDGSGTHNREAGPATAAATCDRSGAHSREARHATTAATCDRSGAHSCEARHATTAATCDGSGTRNREAGHATAAATCDRSGAHSREARHATTAGDGTRARDRQARDAATAATCDGSGACDRQAGEAASSSNKSSARDRQTRGAACRRPPPAAAEAGAASATTAGRAPKPAAAKPAHRRRHPRLHRPLRQRASRHAHQARRLPR